MTLSQDPPARASSTQLVSTLFVLLKNMCAIFSQERSQCRAFRLAIGTAFTMGQHTIARMLASMGRDQLEWCNDYRIFSHSPWSLRDLFKSVLTEALCQELPHARKQGFVLVAGDHTDVRKTGKHIAGVRTMRDPLSPPYHVNLMQGLRYFHLALIVCPWREKKEAGSDRTDSENNCIGDVPPRAIPVRFESSPTVKKPGKKADEQELAEYRKQVRSRPAAKRARREIEELRADLDSAGVDLPMLVALDGGFCNRVFLREEIKRVELLCRCRKDAVLCFPDTNPGRRVYAKEKFRPQEVRVDEKRPWHNCKVNTGGRNHAIRYKEINEVLWQRGSGRRAMRLIVVAPTGYRLHKKGRLLYRQPAYLLTTDLETPVAILIQAYVDRWQIEVAHRELKEDFGLQDTQVRHVNSVPRHIGFEVAVYAMIHLATLKAYGPLRTEDFLAPPKWAKPGPRPSFIDILRLLRHQIVRVDKRSLPEGMLVNHRLMVEKAAA